MTSEKFMILPRKRHLGVPAEKTFGGGVRFNTAIYPVSAEKQRDKKTARRRESGVPFDILILCAKLLELVFIGNICGFSSKFFCRQGKNLQAYFRMARIFNAVCNKICRKDVDRRL